MIEHENEYLKLQILNNGIPLTWEQVITAFETKNQEFILLLKDFFANPSYTSNNGTIEFSKLYYLEMSPVSNLTLEDTILTQQMQWIIFKNI